MASTSAQTASDGTSTDCEVTLSDQKLINRFARLNAKCEELQGEINAKTRQLENIEEAINELIVADSDDIHIQIGEVFARLETDSANDLCEQMKKQLEDSVADKKAVLEVMRDEMSSIKVKLYAKFGNNINLEYDDDKQD